MMTALDKQIGGNHYKHLQYQPVEFLSDNLLPASLGYAIKYISRYPNKNQDDLDKAYHCIELFEDWFKKNCFVDNGGSIIDFPPLKINLNQVIKYTHQFSSQKAIVLQQICQLANLIKYMTDDEIDAKDYFSYIDYVKETITAYKEGLLE